MFLLWLSLKCAYGSSQGFVENKIIYAVMRRERLGLTHFPLSLHVSTGLRLRASKQLSFSAVLVHRFNTPILSEFATSATPDQLTAFNSMVGVAQLEGGLGPLGVTGVNMRSLGATAAPVGGTADLAIVNSSLMGAYLQNLGYNLDVPELPNRLPMRDSAPILRANGVGDITPGILAPPMAPQSISDNSVEMLWFGSGADGTGLPPGVNGLKPLAKNAPKLAPKVPGIPAETLAKQASKLGGSSSGNEGLQDLRQRHKDIPSDKGSSLREQLLRQFDAISAAKYEQQISKKQQSAEEMLSNQASHMTKRSGSKESASAGSGSEECGLAGNTAVSVGPIYRHHEGQLSDKQPGAQDGTQDNDEDSSSPVTRRTQSAPSRVTFLPENPPSDFDTPKSGNTSQSGRHRARVPFVQNSMPQEPTGAPPSNPPPNIDVNMLIMSGSANPVGAPPQPQVVNTNNSFSTVGGGVLQYPQLPPALPPMMPDGGELVNNGMIVPDVSSYVNNGMGDFVNNGVGMFNGFNSGGTTPFGLTPNADSHGLLMGTVPSCSGTLPLYDPTAPAPSFMAGQDQNLLSSLSNHSLGSSMGGFGPSTAALGMIPVPPGVLPHMTITTGPAGAFGLPLPVEKTDCGGMWNGGMDQRREADETFDVGHKKSGMKGNGMPPPSKGKNGKKGGKKNNTQLQEHHFKGNFPNNTGSSSHGGKGGKAPFPNAKRRSVLQRARSRSGLRGSHHNLRAHRHRTFDRVGSFGRSADQRDPQKRSPCRKLRVLLSGESGQRSHPNARSNAHHGTGKTYGEELHHWSSGTAGVRSSVARSSALYDRVAAAHAGSAATAELRGRNDAVSRVRPFLRCFFHPVCDTRVNYFITRICSGVARHLILMRNFHRIAAPDSHVSASAARLGGSLRGHTVIFHTRSHQFLPEMNPVRYGDVRNSRVPLYPECIAEFEKLLVDHLETYSNE